MSAASRDFSEVDRNVAANVREARERRGLSQEELAQQMSDRGFGFSQATIWKIESGQRPVKISEAVALSDALGSLFWRDLTTNPEVGRHLLNLEGYNRACANAYEVLKQAAATYLDAQVQHVFAIYEAQEAGIVVHEALKGWLDIPAERAVLEARVDNRRQDEVFERRDDEVDALLNALREHGYGPLRAEDIVEVGPSEES